jgi:ADP-dependent NAD(P)H-hydrate dehydratase / NAD(P)H-hydrate epimerase
MKIITTRKMQALDQRAIRQYGIPSLILMENAGRGIADLALRVLKGKKRVVIIAGKGNNGGDAFVVARHLFNRNIQVRVFAAARTRALKEDSRINFQILKKMRIPVKQVSASRDVKRFGVALKKADLIVDGIFGVGLHRVIEGVYVQVVKTINRSRKPVLAIDVPSGLNSDTGEILGAAVRARWTGTLGAIKKGLMRKAGPGQAGTISVIDISIPRTLL